MYLRVFVYGLLLGLFNTLEAQRNLKRNLRGYDGFVGRVGFEASVRVSLVWPF